MGDKVITCADCGQSFTFSAGEQDFYQQKGMSEPKRCKECRAAKKAERGGGGGGGNRRGGGGSGGGGGRGGSYNQW
ncbi:MAG TPA: zinc-ribbon domain-containing protein [Blastocatellia bacterium]|nr:zinc-ribbon domain-containing protein [Blastocatellia bacterium]